MAYCPSQMDGHRYRPRRFCRRGASMRLFERNSTSRALAIQSCSSNYLFIHNSNKHQQSKA
eukprot:scaffold13513_cov207-Alexandrium_tamarense.AAC.1